MKRYYWADDLEDYSADNDNDVKDILEIKRLNFFIGRKNSGKSRFLRKLFIEKSSFLDHYILTSNTYDDIYSDDKIISSTQYHNDFMYYSFYRKRDIKHKDKFYKDDVIIAKNYIPIFRSLRKIQTNSEHPHFDLDINDYFSDMKDEKKYPNQKIINGEKMIKEILSSLTYDNQTRDIFAQYQNILSKYFFDSKSISISPMNIQLYIHIGGEDRQPIHLLGDGLQQAIILTYEAFIKKDEVHAFFIEEPELHMHPGMLRQLMNFYLNETSHYYFFTTHSNHLLDMVDESDEVIIQKFSKTEDGKFLINRCDKDRDLLASLGVKPSSVYLANCTIWVEGITDRLYMTKYMQKYLSEIENTDPELHKQYLRFMPNYHYTFVEYAGSNLTHWYFADDYPDQSMDQGLSAKAVASEMLLIADGDIQNKGNRLSELTAQLSEHNFLLLQCKEIENTLPSNIVIATAKDKFSRMHTTTTDGFDINLLDNSTIDFYNLTDGIGRILDNAIRNSHTPTEKCIFSDSSGTIKKKLEFCRDILKLMDTQEWQLTPSAKELCEKIFNHVERCNS